MPQKASGLARECVWTASTVLRHPVTSTVPHINNNADNKYTRAARLLEKIEAVDVAAMMLQARRFRCQGRADRAQRRKKAWW